RTAEVRRDCPGVDVRAVDAVMEATDIDLVVIATPNDSHHGLARQALLAGKAVVIDKPFAVTSAQADEIADLAQARGLFLSVFHNRRWDGDFLTVRDLLASGQLGRVTHFESHFDRFRPYVRQRWREDATRGGGLLFDLGPHLIDQALALFGAPQTVYASVKAHRDQATAPDYVHLQLGYASHEVLLHASALTAIVAPRFTIHGARGSYVKYGLDTQEDQLKAGLRPGDAGFAGGNEAGTLRVLEGEGDQEVERALPTRDGAYVNFYRALAAAIHGGVAFPVNAQDAVDVMTVIELAQRSNDEGVRLPFKRGS
ncbi:MAG TPA: oxidoreductase, partial [Paraburkholderia sp.]